MYKNKDNKGKRNINKVHIMGHNKCHTRKILYQPDVMTNLKPMAANRNYDQTSCKSNNLDKICCCLLASIHN